MDFRKQFRLYELTLVNAAGGCNLYKQSIISLIKISNHISHGLGYFLESTCYFCHDSKLRKTSFCILESLANDGLLKDHSPKLLGNSAVHSRRRA
jgi:hypothetical protein